MSETSRAARRAMRAKAHRLATQVPGKVDASDYGPEEDLKTTAKTGMRPVSRRAYKKGGKVLAVEGEKPAQNAGRKQRATGGKALVNDFQNRNIKDANEAREGVKHVGGLKRGGRADGGEVPTTRFNISPGSGSRMTKAAGLKTGGRTGKADGGATRPQPKPTNLPIDPYEPMPPKDSAKPKPRPLGPAGQQGYKKGGRTGKSVGGVLGGLALASMDPEFSMAGLKNAMSMTNGRSGRRDDDDDDTGGASPAATAKKRGGALGKQQGYKKGSRTGKSVGGVLGDVLGTIGRVVLPAGIATEAIKGIGSLFDKGSDGNTGGASPAAAPAATEPAKKRGGALSVSDGKQQGTRPTGGRLARESGGAAGHHVVDDRGFVRARRKTAKGAAVATQRLKESDDSGREKFQTRAVFSPEEYALNAHESMRSPDVQKLFGGESKRVPRESGGRTKGKTNINIIIGRPGADGPAPGQPALGGPSGMPVPVPVGPPPLGAVGPQIPSGGPPPGIGGPPPMPMPGGPPMGRKYGGRTSYKDMDAGSRSGLGRLEKTEIEKRKR